MELKVSNQQTLKILNIISWIIFIGLSIDAGGYIYNTIYTSFFNSNAAQYFWNHLNFSSLYNYDKGYFYAITFCIILIVLLKAILFYMIVKITHKDKLNFSNPFSDEIRKIIFLLSYISFLIGLFCTIGTNNTKWLVNQNVVMPDLHSLIFSGADVWIFMAVVLFVVAQIFKRGIEIQNENDLTI